MGSHEIQQLIHDYGLLLVFVAVAIQAIGFPVPGTTVLVAAAVYAATARGLPIEGVIAAGALGALVGTTVGFALGRWRGEGLLLWIGRRLRQSPDRVQTLRAEFAARGAVWLVVGRFMSGLRNITGLVAGASGMPLGRFLSISAAAAAAWSLISALEYYWFGHALAGANTWVQIALVCAGIAWMLVSVDLLRRRALRRLATGSAEAELS